MLFKTSKITQTLNLTKEMHINCGDTMINHAPALIKSGVMVKIKELSDLSGPKHHSHGYMINLCPWNYESYVPLALQKSHAPGTTKK